jgi:hypothetical protein
MGVIGQRPGVDARKKPTRMPQERFSRGRWLLWYPPLSASRSAIEVPRSRQIVENFCAVEDDVDADTLWTQRTRPQSLEISQRTRDSHSAHIDHLSLSEEEEEERKTKRLKPTVHQIGSRPAASGGIVPERRGRRLKAERLRITRRNRLERSERR